MFNELSLQDQKKLAIDQLRFLAKKKGFITFDDILNNEIAASLSIDELDRVDEALLDLGVIIRVTNEDCIDEISNDSVVDRSHLDYERIFRRVIKIDSDLETYINDLRQIVPPRTNEENILVSQALGGDEFARERLITMFLKVVVRMALWFHEKYSLPLSDTIQDGNVGLVLAVEKFANQNNDRFSTYAPWWIRQQMQRNARYSFDDNFYFPIYLKEQLLKAYVVKKTIYCKECTGIYTCPNVIDHISTELSVDRKTAKKYLSYLNYQISIEQTLNSFGSEIIFSDQGKLMDQLDKNLDYCEQQKIVNNLLVGLHDKEIDIIQKRYGFDGEAPMTLDQIAQIYNVTRERIRQIEAVAKSRIMRNHVKLKSLKIIPMDFSAK